MSEPYLIADRVDAIEAKLLSGVGGMGLVADLGRHNTGGARLHFEVKGRADVVTIECHSFAVRLERHEVGEGDSLRLHAIYGYSSRVWLARWAGDVLRSRASALLVSEALWVGFPLGGEG